VPSNYKDMRGVVLSCVVMSRDWSATLKAQRGRSDTLDVDAITLKGGKPKSEARATRRARARTKAQTQRRLGYCETARLLAHGTGPPPGSPPRPGPPPPRGPPRPAPEST
jgi:hypothetical protein